jgi:hypothetical protein
VYLAHLDGQILATGSSPQGFLASRSFVEHNHMQLIHDPGAHPRQSVSMSQQLCRSRLAASGTHIRGKRFPISNCRMSCVSCRSVFCFRTRLLRIWAGSTVHNSNCKLPTIATKKALL